MRGRGVADRDGLAGLVREALDAPAPRVAPAEQLDLLAADLLPRKAGETEATYAERVAALDGELRRGPGRPRGARNVATEEARRLFLGIAEHPLLSLAKVARMGPHGIAQWLGITPDAGMAHWMRALEITRRVFVPDLAPTDRAGNAVTPVLIQVGGAGGAADGRPLWEVEAEALRLAQRSEQYQGLGAADAAVSADERTKDGENA